MPVERECLWCLRDQGLGQSELETANDGVQSMGRTISLCRTASHPLREEEEKKMHACRFNSEVEGGNGEYSPISSVFFVPWEEEWHRCLESIGKIF